MLATGRAIRYHLLMAGTRRKAGGGNPHPRITPLSGILCGLIALGTIAGAGAAEARQAASDQRLQAASQPDMTPVTPARQFRLPGMAQMRLLQLPLADAERYRRIFGLQERGDWAAADTLIRLIRDDRLMGHVLRQRLMHPTAYKASYAELHGWLADWGDHPEAERVHALALKRRSGDDPLPPPPRMSRGMAPGRHAEAGFEPAIDIAPRGRGSARHAGRGTQAGADAEIAAAEAGKLLDRERPRVSSRSAPRPEPQEQADRPQEQADRERTDEAAGLFYGGRVHDAYELASTAAGRSGDGLPRSHWIAGMAAWRLGETARAVRHFEALARMEGASPHDRAAGAFWAARGHEKLGRPGERRRWITRAAEFPRTFYGIIAAREAGGDSDLRFRLPALTARHMKALEQQPAALRAVGLLQAGRRDLAEAELRRIDPRGDGLLEEALVALVDAAGLPALSLHIGSVLSRPGGRPYDAALYPLPPWQPGEGFKVDRALLYALMRQESRFDHRARSGVGAAGLMQLMPKTASYMAGGPEIGTADLFDPEINLELGQRYVAYLLERKEIGDNLLLMMAAYNAGPGTLQRWRSRMPDVDDPLLFLESLPSRETRAFIQQVLTGFWAYRQRLGQPNPSLDAVAAGGWPAYIRLDPPPATLVSENAED
jgi:soluble lytic murein transglycosylase